MQLVNTGEHPGKSSIMYLPLIDMDPNDPIGIYSTLKFISSHAAKYQICPIVTFDQPLWWKAFTLVESLPELQPAVIRLGGFHTIMSFLESIGHLMEGSGLQQLLKVVYAPNAVIHMISGKAVSRSVRGHFLVNAALNSILISQVLNIDFMQTPATEQIDEAMEVASETEGRNKQSTQHICGSKKFCNHNDCCYFNAVFCFRKRSNYKWYQCR